MTRRSMKRGARSMAHGSLNPMLATQVPSPERPTCGERIGFVRTGETNHRSESASTPDGTSCSMHGGCFRASGARGVIASNPLGPIKFVFFGNHTRAKTSASRSISRRLRSRRCNRVVVVTLTTTTTRTFGNIETSSVPERAERPPDDAVETRAPPPLSPPIDPFGSLRPPHPSSSPSFSATFTRRYLLSHELR